MCILLIYDPRNADLVLQKPSDQDFSEEAKKRESESTREMDHIRHFKNIDEIFSMFRYWNLRQIFYNKNSIYESP